MNSYPLIEILAFFCRHSAPGNPVWRTPYLVHVKRIRSRHSLEEGGIRKSYFSIESKEGGFYDLEFDQEELLWKLQSSPGSEGLLADRVLAHMKRHKYAPSDAHRIEPIRFEVFPVEKAERNSGTEPALIDRIYPFRFLKGKFGSVQTRSIETKHFENKFTEKNLHYVIEDTDGRFYHLVYIPDLLDWRFMQEVDEQFFFVRKG